MIRLRDSTRNTLRFAFAITLLLVAAICFGSLQPGFLLFGYVVSLGLAIWLAVDVRGERASISFTPIALPLLVLFLYSSALLPISPHLIPAIEQAVAQTLDDGH